MKIAIFKVNFRQRGDIKLFTQMHFWQIVFQLTKNFLYILNYIVFYWWSVCCFLLFSVLQSLTSCCLLSFRLLGKMPKSWNEQQSIETRATNDRNSTDFGPNYSAIWSGPFVPTLASAFFFFLFLKENEEICGLRSRKSGLELWH